METVTRSNSEPTTRWKLHRFERFLDRHTDTLTERFGAAEANIMRREMLDEYRSVIPTVPDVGGRRNRLSSGLLLAAWALAVYRVVVRHGGSAQDAGELLYRYTQARIEGIPRPLRGRLLGGPRPARNQKVARRSQQRRYPGDWVAEYIDGTDQPFDFGMDYTECGIVKFLHAHDADELTPYICHLDYLIWEAAGAQLTRTKTLAWGCDRCDFRTRCPGTTVATWPPDFPEQRCGQPGP
jgi:hypothetical protein